MWRNKMHAHTHTRTRITIQQLIETFLCYEQKGDVCMHFICLYSQASEKHVTIDQYGNIITIILHFLLSGIRGYP